VRFLRRPRNYPERPSRVEVLETHFAWIFLTDTHAYKLKKSVLRGSMDYRTIAARRRVCCDEVILNRRLAPDSYLAVVPITRASDGTLALGRTGHGRIVDWVVKMHRLPANRMLDHAIIERRVNQQDVRVLVARLTGFFAAAVRQPMIAGRYIEHLAARAAQNQRDLCSPDLGLNHRLVTRITGMQLAFLTEHQAAVGARAEHLIDGHGDLRPEHVYLGSDSDGPCVIDCLEFDAGLRWLDPAEEIAFLALECRMLGARALSRTLLKRYRAATRTPPDVGTMDFYMSHCALTRAKLAAWHLRDPEIARHAPAWRARAQRYLLAAARYIRRANRNQEARTRLDSVRPGRGGGCNPHKCVSDDHDVRPRVSAL
jgi:aminoglycoside phosphotransferase family enzyme